MSKKTASKEAMVFAFYSYKGGTGRTTAAANVAACLALSGQRVLCLDLDLEGPGLSIVFDLLEEDTFQLQKYFEGNYVIKPEDFLKPKVSGLEKGAGSLWVLPASTRLAGTLDTARGGKLLSQLTKLIDIAKSELEIDVLIIDTPSGFGDLSALSMYVSDCVVTLFRFSRQHLLGTAKISDFVKKNDLRFIAAASCVPLTDSNEKTKYVEMVKTFYSDNLIELKEDDSLKWRERVIVKKEGNKSQAQTGYEELAKRIIKELNNQRKK
ncbi:MAG TPA: AAA family ATPase [Pyrinomonadaceae bacterium]|jgi:MinD-like ATPase involved in chromosome partitioning or flagellar assembly